MIVKNESKIIERCIDSVLPYIDAISIVDTESIDNTIELIKNYEKKIPTNVVINKWKNFGHNRSLSFTNSVEFCKKLDWE